MTPTASASSDSSIIGPSSDGAAHGANVLAMPQRTRPSSRTAGHLRHGACGRPSGLRHRPPSIGDPALPVPSSSAVLRPRPTSPRSCRPTSGQPGDSLPPQPQTWCGSLSRSGDTFSDVVSQREKRRRSTGMRQNHLRGRRHGTSVVPPPVVCFGGEQGKPSLR